VRSCTHQLARRVCDGSIGITATFSKHSLSTMQREADNAWARVCISGLYRCRDRSGRPLPNSACLPVNVNVWCDFVSVIHVFCLSIAHATSISGVCLRVSNCRFHLCQPVLACLADFVFAPRLVHMRTCSLYVRFTTSLLPLTLNRSTTGNLRAWLHLAGS